MKKNVKFLKFLKDARNNMEENGYSYTSVTSYMRTWRSIYNFCLSKNIEEYSAEIAETYMLEKYHMPIGINEVEHKKLSPYMAQKIRAIRALTDYKLHGYIQKITNGEKIEWPDNCKIICEKYINLKKSQNLSPSTVRRHELDLFRFVSFLTNNGAKLKKFNTDLIFQYFKQLSYCSKSQLTSIRSSLINAFEYFYNVGYFKKDISIYVPKVNYYAQAKIQKVWSENEISKMLASIDTDNPTGKRDYAIMLLAANLGLRTSDIVNLKINNINWNNNSIDIVQFKTKQPLSLPLSKQIGLAIIDYWKNARPESECDEIFISHTSPYQKLSQPLLYHIFNKYYDISGIKAPIIRQHGLHSLRHSLASRLLEKGTPVNVISNILGHVNSNTASHYLKVDIEKLRQCSLEVPEYE